MSGGTYGRSLSKTLLLLLSIVLGFTLPLLFLSQADSADLSDSTYDALFKQYGNQFLPEYEWQWVKAQAYQESLLDPQAKSYVGASGLMQIMPRTGAEIARQTGITGALTNPTISVLYGTFYMRRMLNIWSSPRTDLQRLDLAQASFNAGAGNIIKAQKLSGGHLLWCGISPHLHQVTGRHSTETLNYVARIHRWHQELTQ